MEWNNLYTLENYEHYLKVADGIYKSRAVQKPWLNNPESILFVMQKGIDMGISPLIALDKIRKMGQNWMLDINLVRSLVAEKGGVFEVVSEDPAKGIKTRLTRGDTIHEESVSMEEISRAGSAGNPNWKKFPKQMLRAAAFRQSCVVLFSDVLHGNRIADFAVESEKDFTDTDESIDPTSVTESDSKPKVTAAEKKATATRKRRSKKRMELEKLVSETKPVGDSIVETDSDQELLKEAGYQYSGQAMTWIYEPKREHMDLKQADQPAQTRTEEHPLAPAKKPEPAAEEPPPPESSDAGWDTGTNQSDTPVFNFQNTDHVKILTEAAATFSWPKEVDDKVKANFLDFAKGKGYKADLESLKKGLQECASQFLK